MMGLEGVEYLIFWRVLIIFFNVIFIKIYGGDILLVFINRQSEGDGED